MSQDLLKDSQDFEHGHLVDVSTHSPMSPVFLDELEEKFYFKANFEAANYIALSADHSWSFLSKLELGYGNGYGAKDGYDYTLPFTDNFYAGGQNFRGFENRVIGPRAVYRFVNSVPGLPDPLGTGAIPNLPISLTAWAGNGPGL